MTEAHHLDEWTANHGETNIDRLELKCHTCHTNEHKGTRRPRRAA